MATKTYETDELTTLPEWADKGTVEQIEASITGYPVFNIEDSGVWVSGMNANCHRQARDVARTLEKYCGCIVDLEYSEDGGYFVPVRGVIERE